MTLNKLNDPDSTLPDEPLGQLASLRDSLLKQGLGFACE